MISSTEPTGTDISDSHARLIRARRISKQYFSLDDFTRFKIEFLLAKVTLTWTYRGSLSHVRRWEYIQEADGYLLEALLLARNITEDSSVTEVATAEVQLYQAFSEGRKAMLVQKEKEPDRHLERSLKDEAVKNIRHAMHDLRISNRPKHDENLKRANLWLEKLSTSSSATA